MNAIEYPNFANDALAWNPIDNPQAEVAYEEGWDNAARIA
uniref:Uncharacterized protein n=1 Tax=Candidatus Kentrum sp. MB TaxID=2138164 RepID=A0A451BD55_9GAMM|nr:MAG: hypothetical protein BECKMB1821I_GA0114274_105916 [Candidatus Kentron sp. MB]VFK76211.1 MAG: hypothetical protein BECKMB1821H_GA0114242_104615 [Candidatus Kentron sp. MB]